MTDRNKNSVRSDFESYAKDFLKEFGLSNDSSSRLVGQFFDILNDLSCDKHANDNDNDPKGCGCSCNCNKEKDNTAKANTVKDDADYKSLFTHKEAAQTTRNRNINTCRYYLAVNDAFAEVSKSNGKFFINGAEVSESAFNNAISIIESDGDSLSIINSINDIEREYRLEIDKNQKRIDDIERQMKALQEELAKLRK